MKPSLKQLLFWANRQRQLYKAGRLSLNKVAKLESLPNWSWEIASLPDDPPSAYGEKWKGWNDFLGVDPDLPEGQKNIEQDQRDKERLAK